MVSNLREFRKTFIFKQTELQGDFFLGRVSSKLVFKISLLTHRNENVWKIV